MEQAGQPHRPASPGYAAPARGGPPTPAPAYLRPQTFGSILRNMIRLYRENFIVLFVLYGMPQLILNLIVFDLQSRGASPLVRLSILLTVFFLAMICVGPVSVALSEACLGLRPTVRRAIRRAVANGLWRVPVVSLLTILAGVAGLVLLIVPGLIAMTRLMLAVPVLVLEGLTPVAALKRSWRLTNGSTGRNLAYLIGVGMIFYACLALIGGVAVLVIVFAPGLMSARGFGAMLTIMTTIVSPLLAIFPVLLYYDMRVRREDYNVEALEQDLST